jgi:hypothetical protein
MSARPLRMNGWSSAMSTRITASSGFSMAASA